MIIYAIVTAQAEVLASATLNITYIRCKQMKDTWTQARIWSSARKITLPLTCSKEAAGLLDIPFDMVQWDEAGTSLFRCPLIYKEERLWNVKCRLGPVVSAFSPLSAKENRAFSTLSCAPYLAVWGEQSQ